MEDGNGIELSLGLPCGGGGGGGGSVDKQKNNKDGGNSVDNSIKKEIIEIDESDNESKDSKPNDKPNDVADTDDSVKEKKAPENFFTNLGGKSAAASVGEETSNNEVTERNDPKFINYEGLWGGNDNKLKGVVEEEKSDCLEMGQKSWLEASNNKRKMAFEEINCSKKPEKDVQQVETLAVVQRPPQGSSEIVPDERKTVESVQGGKQHIVEEGGSSSSSQARDDVKENGGNVRTNAAPQQHVVDGFPPEGSAIRPGIAPGLRFGGSGSYPNLPWVSTTGPGPNGKTISGVAYRYDKNHVKIVCACHGSHMSGEDFVQHARGDQSNHEFNTDRLSYSTGNPAASAKS